MQVIRILLASTIGEQSIVSEKAVVSESKPNSFSASPGKRYSFVDAKRDVCCHPSGISLATTNVAEEKGARSFTFILEYSVLDDRRRIDCCSRSRLSTS